MRKFRGILAAGIVALGVVGGVVGSETSNTHHGGFQTKYGLEAHNPGFGLPPKGLTLPRPLKTSSTLEMLDSVESSTSIFSGLNPTVVAGYTSGRWPTYWNYRGHFKYVVAIMVNTSHFGVHGAAASCLDVEPGDASPSEVGSWMATEIKNGFRPCAYGSLSEMSAIKSNITSHGISLSKVLLWDADWTYSAHVDSGYAATQWTDHFDSRNIDGSTVTLNFVNASPLPPKPTGPKCFGTGWQHTSFCSKVRAQDAALGKVISKEQAYLKVSLVNQSKLKTSLKSISDNISKEQIQLGKDFQLGDPYKKVSAELRVSFINQGKANYQLALINGHIAIEQAKIKTDSTTLHASLKKYG